MFQEIFSDLRGLYAPFADQAVVTDDGPGRYFLATHEVRARDGYRTAFGGVEIGKAYVSVHLMPLYVHPEMLDALSPALRARMQGKSCFNFRKSDAELFDELATVIAAGAARFVKDGRLKPGR